MCGRDAYIRKPCIISSTFTSPHTGVFQDSLVLRKKTLRQNPTEHNTTQTSLPTNSPALRLCALGVCVCKSVESSRVLLRLMYFTADLFHLTVYVCEINLYYVRIILTLYYFGNCRKSASWLTLYHEFITTAGWGLGPDLNVALNFSTLIMFLRQFLFQIPVEAVFVSGLPLIKPLLCFKKRRMFCPIKYSRIRNVTACSGVCSTPVLKN